MATFAQQLRILEAVALENATFRQAGELVNLSGARTGKNFNTVCKRMGLPTDVHALRERADEVRAMIHRHRESPLLSLSEPVRKLLLARSGYTAQQLSPELLAKGYAATVLRRYGPRALLEVQRWLETKGLVMKPCEATSKHDLEDVAIAIAVLRAYGLNVDITRTSMPLWPDGSTEPSVREAETRTAHKTKWH